MITKEVNKFMALAPLMLPRLIDSKKCAEPDITEDSAILYFLLKKHFQSDVSWTCLTMTWTYYYCIMEQARLPQIHITVVSLPAPNWDKVCTRSIWCHSLTVLLMESP